MMRRLVVVAILIGVVSCFSWAAVTPPNDVLGWQRARWGMTHQEILDAFKGDGIRQEQPYKYLCIIDKYKISIYLFKVSFMFFSHDYLMNIILEYDPASNSPSLPPSYAAHSLEQLLISKYGAPSHVTTSTSDYIDEDWFFKSTTINIHYAGSTRGFTITYEQPDLDAISKI